MDVVGSEIGQKMRSAIKAKLTELGCYVDDELPDYVMVMVANKRTRAQMEEDLQLFLGDNTDLFVNWLHQVLKKLQEVTVTAPLKAIESEKIKELTQSKEKKVKEKKEKEKKNGNGKKAKKKEKEKEHKRKDDKKIHKTKKKSKYHKMIRPNVPPLLMNIEKQSEPSITDVFAGQILKNHGIDLDDDKKKLVHIEEKNVVKETKRPILPIIDPATISTQPETVLKETSTTVSMTCVREEQMKEMHEIEVKISGLKQKLADQLESMSDDEDFLNIRTEAEELMNDFAEDSFQEVTQTAPIVTPPLIIQKSPIPSPQRLQSKDPPGNTPKEPIETLPHIELNLPKRSIRERLGARETIKEAAEIPAKDKVMAKKPASPERFTPEREPEVQVPPKSAKSRLCSTPERPQRSSTSEEPSVKNELSKRVNSKVSMLERPVARSTCASVVRVRPRPRVSAPASNLLLKAVADAHKSLLNAPPKIEIDQQKPKRALVLPMRRSIDAQKIVIQVPGDTHAQAHTDTDSDVISNANVDSDGEDKNIKQANDDVKKKDFALMHITKVINNTEYVPNRVTSQKDDTLIIDTINIHSPTVNKDRGTQFIVTMDGYLPNAFLAKKLMMEGLLDDEDIDKSKIVKPTKSVLKTKDIEEQTKEKEVKTAIVQDKLISNSTTHNQNSKTYSTREQMKEIGHVIDKQNILISDTNDTQKKQLNNKSDIQKKSQVSDKSDIQKKRLGDTNDKEKKRLSDINNTPKKRLSDTSEESDTQVIIKQEEPQSGEKRKTSDVGEKNVNSESQGETPPLKKRKASPIVYNVDKIEKERVRERTQSASSDTHVTVSTTTNSHKYDSVLPLSQAERKLVWCRSFPLCRYGGACAFAHPRCKFAASCTRRGCVYSHELTASPALSSHVIPAANYKTITSGNVTNICRFYPNCVNPACHYYHPKPCRYGKACVNKLECNFYHNDAPADKWKYSV